MKLIFSILVAVFTIGLVLDPGPASAQCPCERPPLYPYPGYEKMIREIYDLQALYPDRVEVSEFGRSVEGRPLLVMRIHRPGGGDKPAAWIGAALHGNEWIGNRMAMAIAKLLVEQDGKDPLVSEALDRMDFYIAPCLNPDGYYHTAVETCTDDNRPCRRNANGVDLNRNFPLPGPRTIPIAWAGSPDPDSLHYRGPEPLSEPETYALDRFFAEHPEIIGAISWHSYAAVQYPAHCETRVCQRRFRRACKAFKSEQTHLQYPRLQSRFFDSYTGELEDWLYHHYGVMGVNIEIGRKGMNKRACNCDDLFYIFNPINPDWWIENDARAGLAYLLEVHRITGGKRIPEGER